MKKLLCVVLHCLLLHTLFLFFPQLAHPQWGPIPSYPSPIIPEPLPSIFSSFGFPGEFSVLPNLPVSNNVWNAPPGFSPWAANLPPYFPPNPGVNYNINPGQWSGGVVSPNPPYTLNTPYPPTPPWTGGQYYPAPYPTAGSFGYPINYPPANYNYPPINYNYPPINYNYPPVNYGQGQIPYWPFLPNINQPPPSDEEETDDSEPLSEVTGIWVGTWTSTFGSDEGASDSASINLAQEKSTVSGAFFFLGHSLVNSLSVTGLVKGDRVELTASSGNDEGKKKISFEGKIMGDTWAGEYIIKNSAGAAIELGEFVVSRI